MVSCTPVSREKARISVKFMEDLANQQSKLGIMDDEEELGSMTSFSENSCSSSDLMEDATSWSSSSSWSTSLSLPSCPPSMDEKLEEGPLFELSSLIVQLPLKRGLSKYFEGKSQSFTSLSNVKCLEDLVKAEKPSKKKLKYSKSYGGGLDTNKLLYPKICSSTIVKKPARSTSSRLGGRR